jgi:hypothetical protein
MTTIALTIGLTEPIGEWATLVKAVRAWTNRDDWTDKQITEFIAMAEARFNRVLRHPEMEQISTATLTTGNNDLPSDFLSMRAIYVDDYELQGMTPTGLVRRYGATTGVPCHYTIVDSNPRKIRLGPQPAQDIAVTIVYHAKLVGVDENNSDNWLLNEHPDLYLYGTLLAAEAYLANDNRLPIWKSAYDEALSELDMAGNNDRFGASPLSPVGFSQIRGVRV